MKKYTIRFNKVHDLDIVSLYENCEFNLVQAVYSTLTAFCQDEIFAIHYPPERKEPLKVHRKIYCRQLILDEKCDAAVIELLGKIQRGYRNNFIKNLLRLYLCMPLSVSFLSDASDMDYFTKKFTVFQSYHKEPEITKVENETLSEVIPDRVEYTTEVFEAKYIPEISEVIPDTTSDSAEEFTGAPKEPYIEVSDEKAEFGSNASDEILELSSKIESDRPQSDMYAQGDERKMIVGQTEDGVSDDNRDELTDVFSSFFNF